MKQHKFSINLIWIERKRLKKLFTMFKVVKRCNDAKQSLNKSLGNPKLEQGYNRKDKVTLIIKMRKSKENASQHVHSHEHRRVHKAWSPLMPNGNPSTATSEGVCLNV